MIPFYNWKWISRISRNFDEKIIHNSIHYLTITPNHIALAFKLCKTIFYCKTICYLWLTIFIFSGICSCCNIFFCITPEQWEEQKVVIWTLYYNLFAWQSFSWFSLSHIYVQFSLKSIHMFVCNIVCILRQFCCCCRFLFSFQNCTWPSFRKLGVSTFLCNYRYLWEKNVWGIFKFVWYCMNIK